MRKTAIFLFDVSGIMAQPWLDAGYDCWLIDIAHPFNCEDNDITTYTMARNKLRKVRVDLTTPWLCPVKRSEIAFVAAFPPCDHLAVSGARWFKGKGLRKLASSIAAFATAAEFCEWSEAPYMIENPVSTISSYWRTPDHDFHPHEYTGFCKEDNYTKKTCLWTGNGFLMPLPNKLEELGEPDHRKMLRFSENDDRSRLKSLTPKGFAQAVFEANHKEE